GDDEPGVVGIHRERAADDGLARHIACLLQHVVDSGPVHGQQQHVRFARGFTRRAGPRVPLRLACELLQLLLAASVAEYDLVAGSRPERAELPAHQSRTQDANAHVRDPSFFPAARATAPAGRARWSDSPYAPQA